MKITWSGNGITEGRGAAGADLVSRNHYGNYQKQNSPVTNPNTLRQQNVRGTFATVSGFWNLLSDEERNEWTHYANQLTRQDSMGKRYSLTGQACFISYAFNVLLADGIPVMLPPPIIRPAVFTSFFVVTMNPTEITFGGTFENGTSLIPADMSSIIFATPEFNPGRMVQRNLYLGIERGLPGSDWNAPGNWTTYTNNYPLPTVGMKVFFKLVTIHQISGLRSPELTCSAIMQP